MHVTIKFIPWIDLSVGQCVRHLEKNTLKAQFKSVALKANLVLILII